jgi:hypothetical protein
MIRMADKHHPLRKFHKQQTKPRRTAFNLIRYFCIKCGERMVAQNSAQSLTSFKCSNPLCGRTKKLSRGDNPEVLI